MKRIISMLLAAMLMLGVLAGCGGSGDDDGSQATLVWAMPFYEQKDTAKVTAEVNKLLAEKLPNTKLEFMLDSSYGSKWSLWMAGDTQIDIANVGTSVDTLSEIEKDSFYELDDLIEEYAPSIAKEKEKYSIQYATGIVNGKQYAIPNVQIYINDTAVLCIPESLISYMDTKAMVEAAYKSSTTTEKMYQLVDDYLHAAKASGKADSDSVAPLIGIESMFNTFARRGFAFVGNGGSSTNQINVCYRVFADKVEMIDFYETDEFKMFIKWARKWYEEGFISTDILSGDQGYGNRSPIISSYVWDMNLRDENEMYLKAGATEGSGVYWLSVQSNEQKYISDTAVGSLHTYNVIPCTSKHPERAMKLLELLRTEEGADILNMICYGIEGTHYEKLSDTEIKAFEYEQQGTSASSYGIPNWMVGTHLNMYVISPYTEETRTRALDYYENVQPKFYKTPTYGMSFDTSAVSNYYSQINSVLSEYQVQLYSGAIADYETKYAEACTKMKAAGIDKVLEELQKQVDEFVSK
ncbi:MAG: ABC transporter substrate-binding protein [Clostridia bacterium]|nr:ABC transporter substrate-binding protein [Clostridia bacterium]